MLFIVLSAGLVALAMLINTKTTTDKGNIDLFAKLLKGLYIALIIFAIALLSKCLFRCVHLLLPASHFLLYPWLVSWEYS